MKNVESKHSTGATEDVETLQRLNFEYVESVDKKNVAWFESHLAPDFLNTNTDGSLVEREAFLAQIARGAGVSGLAAQDVIIRVLGDFAIIHARTTYTSAAGQPGHGRYTDIWSRRAGSWLCVAAHVTRC
ncbi:MAG: nuclear transport factor 2 family protein [Sulfurifustis sp.]